MLAVAVACGRVGFEPRGNVDAARSADGPEVSWVKPFVGQFSPSTNTLTDTFTAAATHAGDVVLVHAYCHTSSPTAVSITATGWGFVQIGPIAYAPGGEYTAASLGAVAPDTNAANFTVSWTSAKTCDFIDEIGDEFTDVDATTPFDAYGESAATGTCTVSVTTRHDRDSLWAACTTNFVSGTGAGDLKGADDGDGDWTEYSITPYAANATEQVTFQTTTQSQYVMTAVALRPR